MMTIHWVYTLAGLFFAAISLFSFRDATNPKRLGNGLFWALLSLSMWAGDALGDFGNGLLVIALTLIAGTGQLGRGAVPADSPSQAPAATGRLFGIGLFLLRARPTVALHEGRRLLDSVGWAAILPQMLASLGAVFAVAGVGSVVGELMRTLIPSGSLIAAVIAFGLGMAVFTMIMGNAFAAFPVMIAAIGMPLLITQYHGNPAVVAAIGMLAGFCGTLMTPMAANFNLVPAALLELKDRYGVVRRQIPTAVVLLVINIGFIYLFAFR